VKKLSTPAIEEHWDRVGKPPALPPHASTEEHAERLQGYLTQACNAAMPVRSAVRGKKAVHWWSDQIAELRKAAIAARRRYQRSGRRANASGREESFLAYNQARNLLRTEIRRAQEKSWRELCDSVDSDPWGVPYRLVTKRLGRRPPAIEEPTLTIIVRGLFPALPAVDWSWVPLQPTMIIDQYEEPSPPAPPTPPFTPEELREAVRKLPSGKAPGPDCIPNEVIKLAAKRSPEIFLETYNACLTNRYFPRSWKCAKLVLLHKGGAKPLDQPSSFRPISLLDGGGKLLERLLLYRLEAHIERFGALSKLQFGFRRFHSTTDAIEKVLEMARAAASGAVQHGRLCAVVTIDVKNAFNTAPWRLIDEALQRASVPEYLIGILRSYMADRKLLFGGNHTANESSLPVTCGVPQGSVLGPTLWNIFYDGILRLPVNKDVKLIAFADDVAIVATAKNAELLEKLVNSVLSDVADWMLENGLALAPEKSECVMLTRKNSYRTPDFHLQGVPIPVKRDVRYLY